MGQPVLLCYNLKDEAFKKVRLAARRAAGAAPPGLAQLG